MLFSLFGEISLSIIGFLWVFDLWFDSFINLEQMEKEGVVSAPNAAGKREILVAGGE